MSSLLNANYTTFRHVSRFRQYFSWYDYILFSVMLLVSAAIGLYYGYYGNRNKSTEEYLMGRRSMGTWPLTISLIAGHTSGMLFLGLPADVYMFGAMFALSFISNAIAGCVVAFVFMPVFYKLRICSTYEYLERRFDKRCRRYASGMFTVYILLTLPVVVYTPALAFETVTGTNLHFSTVLIRSVCVFYTALGGFKAVVWTDALQFVVTTVTLLTIFALGIRGSGGFGNIWQVARENGRLDVSFSLDPTNRETFWSIFIGFTVQAIAVISVNHTCVQKLLAVKTYKESVKMVFGFIVGMVLINQIIIFTSLAMFTRYSGCDPLSTKQINQMDELMPYFAIDVFENTPGLGGLFIAGLFCDELSTLSADLNTVVCTLYEDFLKTWLSRKNNPKFTYATLKLLGVLIGVMIFLMVFIVQKLGGIFSLLLLFMTIVYSPILASFTLGILFPTANAKGAFWGSLIALFIAIFMAAGNKYYTYLGMHIYPTKPLSVDGCPFPTNVTLARTLHFTTNKEVDFQPFFLFRISLYWHSFITTAVGIISGLIISYFTQKNDPPIDINLLSPLVHSWYRRKYPDVNQNSEEVGAMVCSKKQNNEHQTTQTTD